MSAYSPRHAVNRSYRFSNRNKIGPIVMAQMVGLFNQIGNSSIKLRFLTVVIFLQIWISS